VTVRRLDAFLNVPYDREYEALYIALVAGLCAFGLKPRATLELPGPQRRLDRVVSLIRGCRYSFHDLSRVQLSAGVPRFNMPFELGLAVEWSLRHPHLHSWVVLEARPHRLQRSLSDLNGTDPYCHRNRPAGLLLCLAHALIRVADEPSADQLHAVHRVVRLAARDIRRRYGTLYGARAFTELAYAATNAARELQ